MSRDSQQIPGFGFDPGYEPASHPAQAPPSSASIFGLISKVNKGILKSPKSNNSAAPELPAMKQAKAAADRLLPTETPSLSKQKAFQNAKSVIENIQRGIWNPPASEPSRSNVPEPGFKVPLGLPKTKAVSSTVGNTPGGSAAFNRGNNKTQPIKQHNVAIPKSLVAYDDEDSMKKSCNFNRERALEEIDRYRGPSTNQRRDNKNEANRKTDKEPYKSDFDRYYYADRSQRNEMSDKLYGYAERKSNVYSKSTEEVTGKPYNEGSLDYDYSDYGYTENSNSETSYRDYQYEDEKESFSSHKGNAGSMQDSSYKMNTGVIDLKSQHAGNQYGKSSSIVAHGNQYDRSSDSDTRGNQFDRPSDIDARGNQYDRSRVSDARGNQYNKSSSSDIRGNQYDQSSGSRAHGIQYDRSSGSDTRGNQYDRSSGSDARGDQFDRSNGSDARGNQYDRSSSGDARGNQYDRSSGIDAHGNQYDHSSSSDTRGNQYDRSSRSDSRGNQYHGKSNGSDSQELYDYGHTGQSYGRSSSSYETNRSRSDKDTPYKNDLNTSSRSDRNQGGTYQYSNDNSQNRGDYDDNYGRNNDKFYRGQNKDSTRLDEVVDKVETVATRSTKKSPDTELYENYLFGDEDAGYEPSGNYNRSNQVEYVPTVLGNKEKTPPNSGYVSANISGSRERTPSTGYSSSSGYSSAGLSGSRDKTPSSGYSSAGSYNTPVSHLDMMNRSTGTSPSTRYDNRPVRDDIIAVTDDQKAKVAGIVKQPVQVSTYKPLSAVAIPKGVPAPVPAPVSAPIPSGPIAPPGLYCKDCCTTCPDQNSFDSHLKSDIHILTLQKKAQELFCMEARQSRFDKDSSGNPLKVDVLPTGSGGTYTDDRSADTDRRSESPTRYSSRSDDRVQVIPPKPLGPLEARSLHDTRRDCGVTIQWRKLHEEEEKLIDKYVVEYRNAREIRWAKVGSTTKHYYEVNGLQEGTDYLFRVYSTNRNEKSDYLESVLITTKKRRGFSPVRGRRRSSRERDHPRRSSKETDHKPNRDREPRLNRDRQKRLNNDRERRSSRERPRLRVTERDTAGSKGGRNEKDVRDDRTHKDRKNISKPEDGRSKETKDKDSEERSEKVAMETDAKQHEDVSSEEETNTSGETSEAVKENEKAVDNNPEGVECLLYKELDNFEDEPVLGLDHIYEIRSYSAKIPPRYICKLCNNKGSHNIIVRHIFGFPHKLNYFKQYDTEVYDLISMIAVKKQQVERANYEARCIEDKIGRGAVRVMLMLNPHDNDGKIKYRDPILVQAPPPKRNIAIGEIPESEDVHDKSMFDILYNDAVESGYLQDTLLIGLSHVKELIHPQQEKDPKFTCGMCNVMCSSFTIFKHIVGKKHRFNYLKAYHEEMYEHVQNAKVNKYELLYEKIKELAEKDGAGTIKAKISRSRKLWRDRNNKGEESSVQTEEAVEEYTEHVTEEGMEATEDDPQPKTSVAAIKFDIKKSDPQSTNINPVNVLELDKSQKGKEAFDWNKENGLLQSRIQNDTIVKSSRKSKFITVYSEFFKRIPVIGMQWVTEFQRPDPKAEPWYMCFMCQSKLQWKNILDHVTSNLHRLNYMKKTEYRQKYDAVYNVIKTNKQEARPMIETFSKEISNAEGPPTELQVMLELQVNTEAFKAVAKVQENVKAHASSVAVTTTTSTNIMINIATTSLPQTLSSVHNRDIPLNSKPVMSEIQTSSVPSSQVPSSQQWPGSGQSLIQGPSGVCPPVPPPLLPLASVRLQGSTSAIPQQSVPMHSSVPNVQNLAYPPQNTTPGFQNVRMPNIYAPPPVYPNQGMPSLPIVPNAGINLGQAVPSSNNMAVPVRGLVPNVANPPPFQPIFQQHVPNARPLLPPPGLVTQLPPPVTQMAPVSVYPPAIPGQTQGQILSMNEVAPVQNVSSNLAPSNSAAIATTMHSTNPMVRPPSFGTQPPWQRQPSQFMPNQVGPRQMMNPRPLLSMPNPRMVPPPGFVSKPSEVSLPASSSTNAYSASSLTNAYSASSLTNAYPVGNNTNVAYKVSEPSKPSSSSTHVKPVSSSSEIIPGFNHTKRNISETSNVPSDHFTTRNIDRDPDGFTGRNRSGFTETDSTRFTGRDSRTSRDSGITGDSTGITQRDGGRGMGGRDSGNNGRDSGNSSKDRGREREISTGRGRGRDSGITGRDIGRESGIAERNSGRDSGITGRDSDRDRVIAGRDSRGFPERDSTSFPSRDYRTGRDSIGISGRDTERDTGRYGGRDSGTTVRDSGTTVRDSGTTVRDSGFTSRDSGRESRFASKDSRYTGRESGRDRENTGRNSGIPGRDSDISNLSRRGVKRLSGEREEFDPVKRIRSDDRHSSSPRRDYGGRISQESSSKSDRSQESSSTLDREREHMSRKNIQRRHDQPNFRDNPRDGNNSGGRNNQDNLRSNDNYDKRQARSPPRRRWSPNTPNLGQPRGTSPHGHRSRSPPVRRHHPSRSPPLRRRYSRSPPIQQRSVSPPGRPDRRHQYQPRGREDKFAHGSNNDYGLSSRKEMYRKDVETDRYFDKEDNDRFSDESAPLDTAEVDDLVRQYSDRVDEEYGFGADVDNVPEIYNAVERERSYEEVGNYYDGEGAAHRGELHARSARNDRNIAASQYRSDRDRDNHRGGDQNEFRRMESQNVDRSRSGRNCDSQRDVEFIDNSRDTDSYRDNSSHGKYMSDNHMMSSSIDDRNTGRHYSDKNTEQKSRMNQEARLSSGSDRKRNDNRDNFQSAGYNQKAGHGSRQRDDRRAGYGDANREGYHGDMDDGAARISYDRMPDPPREEIEELLRRATTMVTPPLDEFEDYQVDDQIDNVESHRNTDRMYNDRSLGHYGNTSRDGYSGRDNRSRR